MPKKYLLELIIAVAFLVILGGGMALAQGGDTTLPNPIGCDSVECIVEKVINFIFGLGITICPILIVWGGFNIATAGDDQGKVTKGKQIITYAIVGLVIIAISWGLANAIKTILNQ